MIELQTWQVYLGLTIIGIFQGIGYAITDLYIKPILKKYHLKKINKMRLKNGLAKKDI